MYDRYTEIGGLHNNCFGLTFDIENVILSAYVALNKIQRKTR